MQRQCQEISLEISLLYYKAINYNKLTAIYFSSNLNCRFMLDKLYQSLHTSSFPDAVELGWVGNWNCIQLVKKSSCSNPHSFSLGHCSEISCNVK